MQIKMSTQQSFQIIMNEDQDTDNTRDKEIIELLRHIQPEQLEQFVAQYAHRHASFKKDIINHFCPQEPQMSIEDYREMASAIFNFEKPRRYGRGYDFYEAAYEAELALHNMLEKAKYFISQNNFEEAAAIAQSVIEAIPRHYEMVDDSSGGLGDVFNDAAELLLALAKNEKAGKELKKEIFHWVGREVKENIYSDYGFDEINTLLIPYTQAAGLFDEALQIAEARIQQAANEYRLETAVMDKIQLLQQNTLSNEVETTINQYISLTGIRKMKVADMVEKKRYPEAIMLIREGIKVANEKALPGTVNDWKDQLLNIYISLNDRPNIFNYAEDLFYNGRDAMKYYHILKRETGKEEWREHLDTLISKHKTGSWSGYPDHVLSQIYIEEQYWDRLLQLAEKAEINQLESLEQYLKPRFPNEMLKLFVQRLTKYAERNMGRGHYKYVAEILKKLRTYPGGNEAVDKLLAEF